MKTKEEFSSYYNSLIKDDEQLIKKAKNAPKSKAKLLPFLFLFPVLFFVVGILGMSSGIGSLMPFLMFGVILFGFGLIVVFIIIPTNKREKIKREFEEKYKSKLINFLLEGKVYKHSQKEYIPSSVFSESNMFGYFNKYKGEDYTQIFVDNKGKDFFVSMCDLHVEEETRDSDGDTDTDTIFSGVFGFVNLFDTYKTSIDVNTKTSRDNKKLSLESIEFDKKYKIYTNDQIIARVVLTPEKMQEILSLNVKNSKAIKLSLRGDKLFFAISGSNLFTTKLNTEEIVNLNVDDFYEDVLNLDSMIEKLKEITFELE